VPEWPVKFAVLSFSWQLCKFMLNCMYLPKQITESAGHIHSSAEINVFMHCVGNNLPLECKLFENGNRSTSVLTQNRLSCLLNQATSSNALG